MKARSGGESKNLSSPGIYSLARQRWEKEQKGTRVRGEKWKDEGQVEREKAGMKKKISYVLRGLKRAECFPLESDGKG